MSSRSQIHDLINCGFTDKVSPPRIWKPCCVVMQESLSNLYCKKWCLLFIIPMNAVTIYPVGMETRGGCHPNSIALKKKFKPNTPVSILMRELIDPYHVFQNLHKPFNQPNTIYGFKSKYYIIHTCCECDKVFPMIPASTHIVGCDMLSYKCSEASLNNFSKLRT